VNWYLEVLKKYAVFSGRARRKEYWYFTLVNFLISLALATMIYSDGINFHNLMYLVVDRIYFLAILIPSIAVTVRRLHDTGKSGWWILIGLVPIAGSIALLIFTVQDSQPGENQYGSNPKTAES